MTGPAEAAGKDLWESVQEDDSHPGRMEQDSLRLVHTTGKRVCNLQLKSCLFQEFSIPDFQAVVHSGSWKIWKMKHREKIMASTHHTEASLHQWGFDRSSK